MINELKKKLNQLYFKDTSFVDLMTKRIFNVLLVANPYDAFMLEDDGRIDEKIFNEYMNLSLRYPPRFTQVSTMEEAWQKLAKMNFDLVICMPGTRPWRALIGLFSGTFLISSMSTTATAPVRSALRCVV